MCHVWSLIFARLYNGVFNMCARCWCIKKFKHKKKILLIFSALKNVKNIIFFYKFYFVLQRNLNFSSQCELAKQHKKSFFLLYTLNDDIHEYWFAYIMTRSKWLSLLALALISAFTVKECTAQSESLLRVGKAINVFVRYGYLSISMKVISYNDTERWIFKEPTKNIFQVRIANKK